MKRCCLCLMPRPDTEPVCAICENNEFSEIESGTESGEAVEHILDGRFDQAYKRLEEEVAGGHEDARTAIRMAWLAFSFRDTRAVETWCHETIRLAPDSPEPHLLLGTVLMRGERWQEAAEEFSSGLQKPALSLERRALLETMCADAVARIPEW